MKQLVILLFATSMLAAQTRPIQVAWTASTSVGVTGYTISTASSAAGPFTFLACTGTVTGQTCVSGSTATTSVYNGVATIGTTLFVQVAPIAPACTPTTPVTTVCGTGLPATGSSTIPAQGNVTSITLLVP